MKQHTRMRLLKFKGFNNNLLLEKYNEPHRHYHTWEHIEDLLEKAHKQGILSDDLFLAIVFHDIIYNPKNNDNEELSAELFYKHIKNDVVRQAILDTKTHKPSNKIGEQLCLLDLSGLHGDFKSFIETEHKIFKEYAFVDLETYKEKRIEILEGFGIRKQFADYIRFRKPNIGVYAGSFNPFHIGHLNILEKAEQIFDKVIIARGVNKGKKHHISDLPEQIEYRQIEHYEGLLTDFIDALPHDVTLIRGLRNANDLEYEKTQYRFLQDLKPNIKVVSIFCDSEFEHVSSTAIRLLKEYNKQGKYLLKNY